MKPKPPRQPTGRRLGDCREQAICDILIARGYSTYRPPRAKFTSQDMHGFDICAARRGDPTLWVQSVNESRKADHLAIVDTTPLDPRYNVLELWIWPRAAGGKSQERVEVLRLMDARSTGQWLWHPLQVVVVPQRILEAHKLVGGN